MKTVAGSVKSNGSNLIHFDNPELRTTFASANIVFQNLVRALNGDYSNLEGMEDFVEWMGDKNGHQNYEKRSGFVGYL